MGANILHITQQEWTRIAAQHEYAQTRALLETAGSHLSPPPAKAPASSCRPRGRALGRRPCPAGLLGLGLVHHAGKGLERVAIAADMRDVLLGAGPSQPGHGGAALLRRHARGGEQAQLHPPTRRLGRGGAARPGQGQHPGQRPPVQGAARGGKRERQRRGVAAALGGGRRLRFGGPGELRVRRWSARA